MGGSITKNYDGSTGTSPNFSRATSIQVVGQVPAGTISSNALSASTYVGGVAESLLSYAPTNKRVEPFALTLRVSDTDGVSSEGGTEQSIGLRSGRMRVANAFGSANQVLQLQVVGEYWSGQNWILNSADSCTAVAAASVALSNRRDALGATSAATTQASGFSLVGGNGVLRLAKPTPAGNSLTVDVAINLGNSTQDTSCHASTVTSVGANAPWLRSEGACKSTATVDPAARASFGVYTPETRRIIHSREIF
jgi:MSHA biogenesis protein MshQ